MAAAPGINGHEGRSLTAMIRTGRKSHVRVTTLYGYDSGKAGANRLNAALSREVLAEAVSQECGAWLVCGDWNAEAKDLWDIVAGCDHQFFLPRGQDSIGVGTCAPAWRKLDYWVASEGLRGRVGGEVVHQGEPLYPHRPVSIQVQVRAQAPHTPVANVPKAFPESVLDEPEVDAGWLGRLWQRKQTAWEVSLEAGDVDRLWSLWVSAAEEYLGHRTGLADKRYRGRDRGREVRLKALTGAQGDENEGPTHRKAAVLQAIRGGCLELARAAEAATVERAGGAEPHPRQHLEGTGEALRKNLSRGTDDWQLKASLLDGATPAVLRRMAAEAEAEAAELRQALRKQRGEKWRAWVREAAKDKPGTLYRWIRGEARSEIQGISTDTGWTMEPGQIAEAVRSRWREYWNPAGAAPWEARSAAGPRLPPIDPAVLAELARTLPLRKAAGIDGWRPHELRALP